MARFYGPIGYAETVEVRPGVWKEQIVERNYYCELLKNNFQLQPAGQVNDNINIASRISIISDPYADQHFHTMRYVEFMGAKWKIKDVDPTQRPRLILTLGGVYNGGEQA